MGVAISSREELIAWLKRKPLSWAPVIALRAALRVLPITCDPDVSNDRRVDPRLPLVVFRASAVLSGASQTQSGDHPTLSRLALTAAAQAAVDANGIGHPAFADAAYAASNARASDSFAASDASALAAARAADSSYAASAFSVARSLATATADAAVVWAALSGDCSQLQGGIAPAALLAQPLWMERPDWFHELWDRAARWLSRPEHGFAIWREWYFDRLEGLPHAFDRFDAAADEAFYRWIIEHDDDWWKRDPATVNADIAAKVETLRRPALPSDEELAQNPLAINFAPDTNGQVALAARRDPDKLDTSERARARHAEIRANALKALEESRAGRAQATDIEQPLEAYLQSLGEHIEDVDAPLLIARGEKLRRLISLRQDPKSSAVPFAEGQDGALADWLTCHNLFIGFDAYLSAVERIARGPDAVPTILDLEALKRVIQSALEANLPADDATQALNDLADNVPPDAAPDDRRLAQATEALKNFIRAVGALVKEHGWKFGLGGLTAAYGAASWVQRNIPWLRDVFSDEPSILSILDSIASLPL